MSDEAAWKLKKGTELDPKAVKLMKDVIKEHHPRLNQFRLKIVLLFRPEPTSSGGKLQNGIAHKCSERERLLSKVDGCVTLAHSWWLENPDLHAALLDHELSHFRVDEDGVLSVVTHDVEEFTDVWQRRGSWTSSLRNAETVMGQMRLPEMDEEDNARGDDDDQDYDDEHDDVEVSIQVVATGETVDTTIGGMKRAAAALAAESAGDDEL